MLRNAAITTIAAVAILLGQGAHAPAQALDDNEWIGLLAGLTALVIIGKEIEDNREKRRNRHVAPHYGGKPKGTHRNRYALPGQCIRVLDAQNGRSRRVLGGRCLQSNNVRLSQLPQQCLRNVATERGPRTAYGVKCLRSYGWAIN